MNSPTIRTIKAKAERLVRAALRANQEAMLCKTRHTCLRGMAATEQAEAACAELMEAGYDEATDGLMRIN